MALAIASQRWNIPAACLINHSIDRTPLPFRTSSFDVVYAHLTLHYFDHATTVRVFDDIGRIVVPGGLLAAAVNSTSDQEYLGAVQLESDYYELGPGSQKRYFTRTSLFDMIRDNFVPYTLLQVDATGVPDGVIQLTASRRG